MSLYRQGIHAGSVSIPEQLAFYSDALSDGYVGAMNIYRGGGRFYNRGVSVGANSPGFVGSVVDGLVGLVLDIVHVMLLVGGGLLVWKTLLAV